MHDSHPEKDMKDLNDNIEVGSIKSNSSFTLPPLDYNTFPGLVSQEYQLTLHEDGCVDIWELPSQPLEDEEQIHYPTRLQKGRDDLHSSHVSLCGSLHENHQLTYLHDKVEVNVMCF